MKLNAFDRTELEAVVANRNGPQKHVVGQDRAADGRWARHLRDYTADRKGRDVALARVVWRERRPRTVSHG
jgi:hypothetical protein